MSTGEIALVWYYKGPQGWRRSPVPTGQNGRIKARVVLQNGVEHKFPLGRFQLRIYDSQGRNVYTNAGTNAVDASVKRDIATKKRNVRRDADAAGVVVVPEAGQQLLTGAIRHFLEQVRERGALVSAAIYEKALDDFMIAVDVRFLHEVSSETVTHYQLALRKKGNSDRTVFNKTQALMSFLSNSGSN